jgi:hypothetical protein
MVHVIVSAGDRHGGKLTVSRGRVNVAARGVHGLAALTGEGIGSANCVARGL